MKTTLMLILATFVLTTGFTCSKNPPAPQVTTEGESQPAQEQMAAPTETAPVAPAEGTTAPSAPETGKEAAPETK